MEIVVAWALVGVALSFGVAATVLFYGSWKEKKELAVVCGTENLARGIKQLEKEFVAQTDRINNRIDYIAGLREPPRSYNQNWK